MVTVLPNGGHFEVSESDVIVTTGRIYEPEFDTLQYSQEDITLPIKAESLPLNSNDIYKELRLIGYEYGPTFQGILESDNLGTMTASCHRHETY